METCNILTHLADHEVLGITSSVRDLKRSKDKRKQFAFVVAANTSAELSLVHSPFTAQASKQSQSVETVLMVSGQTC